MKHKEFSWAIEFFYHLPLYKISRLFSILGLDLKEVVVEAMSGTPLAAIGEGMLR